MTQLGTMMLRAGLLSEQQLSHVQVLSGDREIPFLEALLELGLSNEDAVCAFFHSRLLIPRVDPYLLERLDTRPLQRLPAQVARRHTVLPVSLDDMGNLTLAMADPTDMRAVEEATEHIGAYLVRAVAPLGPLRRAVERYYGADPGATQPGLPFASVVEGEMPESAKPRESGDTGDGAASFSDDDLPSPEDSFPGGAMPTEAQPIELTEVYAEPATSDQGEAQPIELTEVYAEPATRDQAEAPPIELTEVHAQPAPPEMRDHDEAQPIELTGADAEPETRDHDQVQPIDVTDADAEPETRVATPVEAGPARRAPSTPRPRRWTPPLLGVASEPPPLSSEAFGRLLPRLVAARDRDQITSSLLDFLAAGFQRVILFVHLRGELRGHDARGSDLMTEAVRQVRIPSGGESVFSRVIGQRIPYFGPMPRQTTIDRAFSDALGGVVGNVLVLPVLLAGKVPLLLFASGTSYPVDPRSLRELTEASSHALSRLIVAKRSRKPDRG